MKKVVYSIIRYGKRENYRFSGVGEIDEDTLYTKYINRYGKEIEHNYVDCIRYLQPIKDKPNQFQGRFYDFETISFEKFTPSGSSTGYEEREIEVDYNIWIKIIE